MLESAKRIENVYSRNTMRSELLLLTSLLVRTVWLFSSLQKYDQSFVDDMFYALFIRCKNHPLYTSLPDLKKYFRVNQSTFDDVQVSEPSAEQTQSSRNIACEPSQQKSFRAPNKKKRSYTIHTITLPVFTWSLA